jgi:predicted porin
MENPSKMSVCVTYKLLRSVIVRVTWGVIFLGFLSFVPSTACAQDKEENLALRDRVALLERQIATMQSQLAAVMGNAPVPAAKPPVNSPSVASHASSPSTDLQPVSSTTVRHGFLEKKPGKELTFFTPNGLLTFYGNLDVSFDVMTKGIASLIGPNGNGPVGNNGWLADLSTNLSYAGIRGAQKIGASPLSFIYQLETQIDIASSSGISETNSNQSNVVKGGLTSRNSFLGLLSPKWGSVMFGKTDAPYKLSTARMNPFFAMIGDYAAIMGNTGGDNRVEFFTRLDHSIWYASPTVGKGLRADLLYSPGQNRASDSSNIAAGESDCTGGNIPGSGGSIPVACNDGSFSDVVSASLSYTRDLLYLTAAYERHRKVNRASDLTGEYANPPATFFEADTADEDAAKIGAQYRFASRTTVNAVFESMHRYIPDFLAFQNERQRNGYWLSAVQDLSKNDSVSIGWAHANRTPGDPGQHNTSLITPPLGAPGDGVGGPGVDNSANLITAFYKRKLTDTLTVYMGWAGTFNGPYAHYDLGAGGRTVTTDCHDASDAAGGESSNPHCWAGGQLQGVSVGLNRKF